MKATGRQLRIRELLESQEFVDLETLCRELDASESSIRRDLNELEQQRVLKRVHGGALAIKPRDQRLDFSWVGLRSVPCIRLIYRISTPSCRSERLR